MTQRGDRAHLVRRERPGALGGEALGGWFGIRETSHVQEVLDNPTGWVAAHIRRYVESGGTRGHTFNGRPALLLTTRGRRTGALRRTALYYGRDGDRYVLVATPARSGRDPAWYRNLVANPAVVLQVRAETFGALAEPAPARERERLWELMTGVFPKYEAYRREAARDLPIVVVERR